MSELIYQSIHTGKKIDEAVSKVPTLEQQINTLDANKVNKTWGTIYQATLQNGWTGNLEYNKNDSGLVNLRGLINAGTTTNITVIANLPQEFRPLTTIAIWGMNAAAGVNNGFSLGETGNLVIRQSSGLSSGNPIYINCTYKV